MAGLDGLVDIAIPCDEVTVTVTLTPSGGLTHLERAILGAVRSDNSSIETIERFLSTPRRIVLDAVHGLWMRNHLTIDFGTGAVELTKETAAALRSDEPEKLESGTVQSVAWSYLHEPITGAVFPRQKGSRPQETDHQLPRATQVEAEQVPRSTLLRSIQRDIERRDPGLTQQVASVSFGARELRPIKSDRWLTMRARVVQTELGTLELRFTDDVFHAPTLRRRLERHVAHLCETEPHSPFVQRLRGQAPAHLRPVGDLEDVLEKLEERVHVARDSNSAEFELHRDEVLDAERSTVNALRLAARESVTATVVHNGKGLDWTTRTMLEEAQEQVVIAVSKLGYSALNRMLPDVQRALSRGIRVVLLWGDRSAATLERSITTALGSLQRSHGDLVMYSTRPSLLGARYVIQDDTAVLVSTSSAFEIADPARHGPYGVLLERNPRGAAVPAVLEDLLALSREAFPDYQRAASIRMDFPDAISGAGQDETPRFLAPGQLMQPLTKTDFETEQRIWAEGWKDLLTERRDFVRRLRRQGSARLVVGGDHRTRLLRALEQAQTSVLVASRQVHERALPNPVVAAFENSTASVHIKAAGGNLSLLDELDGVTTSSGLVDRALIVADDSVLLAQQDLLSDDDRAGGRSIGVEVRQPEIAAEVWALVAPESAPEGAVAPEPVAHLRPASLEAMTALLEIQTSHSPAGREELIRAAVENSDDPRTLLDEWQERGASTEVLRRAAALLVLDGSAGQSWTQWVVDDALARRAFVEATATASLTAEVVEPQLEVLQLLCPLEDAWLGRHADTVALEVATTASVSRHAARAGAIGLCYEVLASDLTVSESALEILLTECVEPGIWSEVGRSILAFRRNTAMPVPLPAMRMWAQSAELVEAREHSWQEIASLAETERQRGSRWNFETGDELHRILTSDDGLLTIIATAARGDDRARRRLGQQIPSKFKPYADELIHRAGLAPMQWHRQLAFARRIQSILDEAHRASAALSLNELVTLTPHVQREALTLAAVVQERSDAIRLSHSEGRQLDVVAHAFLQRADPLMSWLELSR